MSAQTSDLVLGAGRVFAKRASDADGQWRMIGALSGEVVFTYTKEEAEQKVATSLAPIDIRKVAEEAMIKATVADFKISELRFALGITKSTTQLTNTSSVRLSEELEFGSTTTTKTISRTAKSKTSIHITSLDRGTNYVSGTDYTVLSTTTIQPLNAGFANNTRMVHYTHTFTGAEAWDVGGNTNLENLSLMFVHPQKNKKVIAVLFHKAVVSGELPFNFNDKEFQNREVTFKALEDTTKAAGKRLFKIIREP